MSDHAEIEPTSETDRDEGLGRKLRLRRTIKRFSLQYVAERADISVGLLSQIERGFTTPSLRSLRQICTALDMPVGWLFDVPTSKQEDAVVRASARRALDLGPNGMRKELLSPDEVTGIQMMRIEIRPGGIPGRGSPQRERREMRHRDVRHAGARARWDRPYDWAGRLNCRSALGRRACCLLEAIALSLDSDHKTNERACLAVQERNESGLIKRLLSLSS
jgi:transcriptional regulator with XRE-family HTH domain